MGTSVYERDNDRLVKAGVPATEVGKDEHWIYDFQILCVKKGKQKKSDKIGGKRKGRRRIVR